MATPRSKLAQFRIITKGKILKSFPPVLARITNTRKPSAAPLPTSTAVNTAKVKIRGADPLSIRVIITNAGAHPAKVFEGGQMVMLIPANARQDLPGLGKLVLEAQAIGGATTVTAQTFHRQAVGGLTGGDYLEAEVDPIGSFLL